MGVQIQYVLWDWSRKAVDGAFAPLFREYKDRFRCRIIAPDAPEKPIDFATPLIRLDDRPMPDFVGTRWRQLYTPDLEDVSVTVQCSNAHRADFVYVNLTLLQLGVPFHYAILDNQQRQPMASYTARFAKFVVMFPSLKFASPSRLNALAEFYEIDKSKGGITLARVMRAIADSICAAQSLLVVSVRVGGPVDVPSEA
jgi:hypothetical protein